MINFYKTIASAVNIVAECDVIVTATYQNMGIGYSNNKLTLYNIFWPSEMKQRND
jgi:hypothetical protein